MFPIFGPGYLLHLIRRCFRSIHKPLAGSPTSKKIPPQGPEGDGHSPEAPGGVAYPGDNGHNVRHIPAPLQFPDLTTAPGRASTDVPRPILDSLPFRLPEISRPRLSGSLVSEPTTIHWGNPTSPEPTPEPSTRTPYDRTYPLRHTPSSPNEILNESPPRVSHSCLT